MHHTIKLSVSIVVHLKGSPKRRRQRLKLRKGTRLCAQVKPYVIEGEHGPVEVADLFLEEEGIDLHTVPFACFRFVD